MEVEEIASHPRSYDRGVVIEKPEHYEGILSTKRKHFGLILNKRFSELGPVAKAFLEGLLRADVQPLRHIQQIVNLVQLYGKDDVLSAMVHAASCNAYGAGYVKSILLQRRAAQGLAGSPVPGYPAAPGLERADYRRPRFIDL